ncbi:hypothetical protein D3C71_1602710 [compost metagenome]
MSKVKLRAGTGAEWAPDAATADAATAEAAAPDGAAPDGAAPDSAAPDGCANAASANAASANAASAKASAAVSGDVVRVCIGAVWANKPFIGRARGKLRARRNLGTLSCARPRQAGCASALRAMTRR